ncbi:3-oxoadipate enol-lactonase [Mesorhizobium sp. LHD-90]|uniref:3-oxoadipate enol-lactonase n=1 Tax=Mesorhizobium sp. LHD-90 TaxID=3071414 RepID=UPI0027DFDFB8|nr:3-oxoadipate enol-lactonase [Mesorhizobium sp. LHD-90]MDQ6436246.1 3-oxoadipate enol-lactonase [Mesorhizobium sp. LHD-90]
MAFVRANGIVLHTRIQGRTDGPVLVFGNSLGSDFRIWEDVVRLLDDRYRILLYDKRGHGLSDTPPPPCAIDDHVNDLLALLDHFAIESAAIVGLSVGGMIAQRLAARAPERVKALVLCCTGAKIGTPESWADRIAAIDAGGIDAIAETVLERWFTPSFHRNRATELAGWRNMLLRTPRAGYVATCAAIRDADLRPGAASITAPTLCVAGDHDGATPPELVRATADLIPGARFALIEGAGHIPCVEKPDVLAELVGEHLARHV